jgi:cell division protein FtsI (penicillin-binding protein 3)
MKENNKTTKKERAGLDKGVMSRIYIVYVFLLLIAIGIFLRIVQLQIFKANELNIIAEKREFRFDDNIEAMRGSIYSEDGRLMATSVPVFEVRMDVALPDIKDSVFNDSVTWLALGLSKIFGDYTNWEYKQRLIKARNEKNRFFLIQKNVTFDQLTQLKTLPLLKRTRDYNSLIVIRTPRREYPFGILARRSLGYFKDHPTDSLKVLVGVEGEYNEYLQGIKGRQLKQRMAYGEWKPIDHLNNIEPVNGKDIVVTINSYLQDIAHSSLKNQLIAHNADKGCLILMEVETGELRALVNLMKDPKDGEFKESYNMAVGELFEPGSIFKLPAMMVAIEDGVVQKIDSVYIGNGEVKYNNRVMKDSHRFDPDGWVTPENCLAHSSNVGVSKIIYDHYNGNNKSFYNKLTKMFSADITGVDIPGEPKPFIKDPHLKDKRNYWSSVTLPWMSIGYEVLTTPLQMLTFYNAVANNGKMVLSSRVRKPWAKPSGIQYINLFLSESTTEAHLPYVDDFFRRSTATSNTEPRITLTNLP